MTESTQTTLAIGKPHRNQYLFADHYLEEIMRRDPKVWDAAIPEAMAFLNWLRKHYGREGAQLADYSESQLEDHWFKPIFARLNPVWEGQPTVPGLGKTIKKPDYIFFSDEATRLAVVAAQRTEGYARDALAVGEVKAWNVNLSKKLAGAPVFDNNNPMFQIDYYLKITELHWGIVSNGRLWRLVHKDTSYRLDIYFEVDLFEALTTADERHAQAIATYFWVFFRQAAFLPGDNGRIFLDEVLAGSQRYAVALESDLRDNAYKALEQLILGFFAPAANGLDPDNAADRETVYRNSLLLLYRLLFLFYGESRGLLPTSNPHYQNLSLTELAKIAATQVNNHTYQKLSSTDVKYWGQLRKLFLIIDGRDTGLNEFLGVPRYNGGLFSPERHPFLEQAFVGDQHLIRAIDYLARRRKTENGRDTGYEAVDYRTLGVRQLGSVYEGLLEYKVSKAEEEMITVRKGGKETWVPATARGKAKALETRPPGELYLATDKGERKATGSYYTPDYIVKYIVEQTLGPLVEQARERVQAAVAESGLRDEAAKQARGAELFEKAILSLNVLDPAMGSGHFLVDATNYLAIALATDDFTKAVGAEEAGGDADEADLTYWRRRVVEACIYGVDKNELAVELAKLSLWLVTVSGDKPLSFLDHHLRHGDSLIGAWLKDLSNSPRPDRSPRPVRSKTESDPLFDESAFTTNVYQAVAGVATIEGLPTITIDDVHAKEDTWRQIHDTQLGRWRRLADLWVSAWFGNDMSAAEYGDLARRIQGRGALLNDEQAAVFLDHPAATDNDYFHWELEFPEVFFDQYGRPKGEAAGFDAVVGNPPWVDVQEISDSEKVYHRAAFKSALGKYDLYAVFVEVALGLLSQGQLGLILQNKFLVTNYGKGLRGFLGQSSNIIRLIDFNDAPLFADATTYPLILFAAKSNTAVAELVDVIVFESSRNKDIDFEGSLRLVQEGIAGLDFRRFASSMDDFSTSNPWRLESTIMREMWSRIWRHCSPLSQHALALNRSITTGLNDAYIKPLDELEEAGIESQLIRKMTRAADLKPYVVSNPNEYMIFPYQIDEFGEPQLVALDDYPGALRYFDEIRDSMEARRWFGQTVVEAGMSWYGYLYLSRHLLKPKLMFPKITRNNNFSIDETGDIILLEPAYIIALESECAPTFLLACLNSQLLTHRIRQETTTLSGGFMELQVQYVERLPIPDIQFLSTNGERNARTNEIVERFRQEENAQAMLRAVENALVMNPPDTELAHDLLAYLAQQMITLHQDKQALVADFWTDLEGATADTTTFNKLRDKGKQEASLAKESAARPFVDPDSHSTRSLDESLGWDEAAFKAFVRLLAGPVGHLSNLTSVYNDHAPRYRELVERIERTDWLIDQIVYKLYGLTEEEIAIVEGRG